MAASTAIYATGRACTVSIGGTTYTNAKVFECPVQQAGVVNITHLGGFQKVADGRTDFGRIVVTIPEAGQASIVDTTVAVELQDLNSKDYVNNTCYCVEDGGAVAQRGQSADRRLVFECLDDGDWNAAS